MTGKVAYFKAYAAFLRGTRGKPTGREFGITERDAEEIQEDISRQMQAQLHRS